MRVTTWSEYGLILSLDLAQRAGDGPVAARELAKVLHPVDPERCSSVGH